MPHLFNYSDFSLFEKLYDIAVIGGNMRICAVLAVFDQLIAGFDHRKSARTLVKMIERAVAEKAVQLLVALVARVESAVFICKKCCAVFHVFIL